MITFDEAVAALKDGKRVVMRTPDGREFAIERGSDSLAIEDVHYREPEFDRFGWTLHLVEPVAQTPKPTLPGEVWDCLYQFAMPPMIHVEAEAILAKYERGEA